MIDNYDSTADITKHIQIVNRLLLRVIEDLMYRGAIHDQSKLESPEKELVDKYSPLLVGETYGSDGYKTLQKEMGPALNHHYANNPHHPEYYRDSANGQNGIDGMSLLDIIEMLLDWKAASMRHDNGDIIKSVEINIKQFNISPQLGKILLNTLIQLDLTT